MAEALDKPFLSLPLFVAMAKPCRSFPLLLVLTLAALMLPQETVAVTAFCAELQNAYGSNGCDCRAGQTQLDVVFDCSDLGLTAVPAMAPGTRLSVSLVLHEFILANNSITQLTDDSFKDLRVRALDLSGNAIASVADNTFRPLANDLLDLKLDGDSTKGPPVPAFSHLTDLEVLTLGNYYVQVLGDPDHHYFLALTNLKELTLRGWRIWAMEPEAFRGPDNLQSLTIETEYELGGLPIPVLTHDSLLKLKRLQISRSSIQTISQDAFSMLTQLEELDLSHNHINKIELDSLRGLGPSLKKLSFASNFLKSDGTSVFSGLRDLPNLEELDLSRNEAITEIPDLSNLNPGDQTSLKIFLSHNKITTVLPSRFSNTALRVHTLDLSENSITNLASNAFTGMTHLHVLRLSQQAGSPTLGLPSSLTQSAASLTHLFLDGVGLVESALWEVLPKLEKLQVLDLKSTKLSSLGNLAFEKMTDLRELYLDGNSLTSLGQLDLQGPRQSLKKLYLSGNPLSGISSCALAHYTSFPITLSLQTATLVCDCKLGWLHKAAKEGNIIFLDGHAPRCANLNNELLVPKSYSEICSSNSYTDLPCDNPYTTPVPVTTPGAPTLTLTVIKTTSTSITLEWKLSDTTDVKSFTVRVSNNYGDSTFERADIAPRVFQLEVKPLRSDTQHQVCVIASFLNFNAVTECTFSRTLGGSGASGQTGGSDSNETGIIIGAVIGALLLLVVIAAILYLVVIRRKPKKDPNTRAGPIQPRTFTKSELPAMTDDSRMFTRPKRPVDHHDGMQVVAISDGQVGDGHASNGSAGRVGRAAMLSSSGSYKLMSAGASSLAGTSATGSTSGSQSLYENDHGLLPSPPHYKDRSRRGPRQPGYYNEAFETDKYDEVDMQREVQL